jgi:hypothetical protein
MARNRHKVTLNFDGRHWQKGMHWTEPRDRVPTSFNMEINMPVGDGADPIILGSAASITATGLISANSNITTIAWYQNSAGVTTQITLGGTSPTGLFAIGTATSSPYPWSLNFPMPTAADEYILFVQMTYQPTGAPGTSTIIVSAPFTLQSPAPQKGETQQAG